jgi:hypothetical protein
MGKACPAERLNYLEENIGAKSIKAIAQKFNIKPKSLDEYRRRKGYSIFQISRKLDRSELQIKTKIARLNKG